MNKKQKKELDEIVMKLDGALLHLDMVISDEDYKLGNIPDNLQNSEMYEKIENAYDTLNDAKDMIMDGKEMIEELNETC